MSAPARSRRFALLALILLLAGIFAAPLALLPLKRFAEPLLRARILATLGARLHATITMGPLHLFYQHGLRFEASDLRAFALGAPPGAPPLLTVRSLRASAHLHNLLLRRTDLSTLALDGLFVDLSTANRAFLAQAAQTSQPASHLPFTRLKITDSTLSLEPSSPGKQAILIHCSELLLTGLNDLQHAPAFDAVVTSPIPNLHLSGHFGPINFPSLPDTSIVGAYRLEDAPLNLIRGLTGTLSASGSLSGTLGQIALTGSTQTPNFALDVSAHPFPLHADFRARFDLSSGDLALPELSAHFLHTSVELAGNIQREPRGRHITADLRIRDGRNQDLLTLLSRTKPLIDSPIQLAGHIDLPAGDQRLILRLRGTGTASLADVTWNSPALQQQMDDLSLRASGQASRASHTAPADLPIVHSTAAGHYRLSHANLDMTHLVYRLPGATILLSGRYPLGTGSMSFHGVARTVATASHMETGIKSLLLKPLSPLLKKNGAGMQVPVSFSGPSSDPTLKLDFTHLKRDSQISRDNPAVPHP